MRQSLLVILVLMAWPCRAEEPYRFGPLGGPLTSADLRAFEQAAGPGAQVWAIRGWRSQTLPTVWYVDVFLPPTHTRARLARGPIVHLSCEPQEGICSRWTKDPEPGSYVQVREKRRLDSHEMGAWSDIERPIRVVGDSSDDDLLGLVGYIRTGPGPKMPSGWIGMRVSKGVPIQDIERQPHGEIWVRLTRDGGVGESATVVRTSRGWRVTQVVGGVE